jgi:hypothetical protein
LEDAWPKIKSELPRGIGSLPKNSSSNRETQYIMRFKPEGGIPGILGVEPSKLSFALTANLTGKSQ